MQSNPAHELLVKDLKLSSLLEITQAINANLPEPSLYKIFQFTLLANLSVGKLVLYVKDDTWICKAQMGTQIDYSTKLLTDDLLSIKAITPISFASGTAFSEFDLVIPIIHKNDVLAYVFIEKNTAKGIVDQSFIQTFTNIILVAIENKKFARRELLQEALKKEMQIAREVQSHLFPKDLPSTQQISMKAFYLPHQTIGGDYYDYIEIDENRSLVCIADVSGKGVPAAILMSNVQAALRTMVRYTTDLSNIVFQLNDLILKHTKGNRFVTMFIGIIDFSQKELTYINAGHNTIPLIQKNTTQLLNKGCTILGMFDTLHFIEVTAVTLLEKNHLFLYTDGLSECMNEQDEEFELERILPLVALDKTLDQQVLIDHIIAETVAFKGERSYNDDITLLSCLIQF
ncbi:PP2C family protein-serine/threonine phosphatase [uncultured Cytophaga sp.]|uniref:PP2C family protein-serine/threonine phosphatase n=1 Tax=uncultured Cytophaga sp. TaxID=160238 RepID=UPI00261C5F93|nr:PP2C family protein-serine/threonine phosphatase [uncultured Cytophaga sp.]